MALRCLTLKLTLPELQTLRLAIDNIFIVLSLLQIHLIGNLAAGRWQNVDTPHYFEWDKEWLHLASN